MSLKHLVGVSNWLARHLPGFVFRVIFFWVFRCLKGQVIQSCIYLVLFFGRFFIVSLTKRAFREDLFIFSMLF